MRALYRLFWKGLVAILPVIVTFYLLYWLGTTAERTLGAAVRWMAGERWYVPGMGVALGLVSVVAVGALFNAWLTRKLWSFFEAMLDRVPLVRWVYGSVKNLVEFLGGDAPIAGERVVLVSIGGPDGPKELGVVMREDVSDLPEAFAQQGEDVIAVYLPWSYQMGGFTVYVPRARTTPVPMSVEEALRLTFTGAIRTGARTGQRRQERDAAAAPAAAADSSPADATPPTSRSGSS